jgi:penicillin-binding protein 1A
MRPVPYVVESIERDGEPIYRHAPAAVAITSVDKAAFYQLKSMMQGVLARGTARSIANLAPYVAGKTGTSDDENDAWFVGFSNEVTVAVWLGYDNSDGKRRTLGGGSTGGGVAVPIFEPVIEAVWAHVTPRTTLAPPSPEAKRHLSCRSLDRESGEVLRSGGIGECLRLDGRGRVIDTQYKLISRARASARHYDDDDDARQRCRYRRASGRVSERDSHSERRTQRTGYIRRYQSGWGGQQQSPQMPYWSNQF